MDKELILVAFLTFIIHLIATLAYAVRIAGARTGADGASVVFLADDFLRSALSGFSSGPCETRPPGLILHCFPQFAAPKGRPLRRDQATDW